MSAWIVSYENKGNVASGSDILELAIAVCIADAETDLPNIDAFTGKRLYKGSTCKCLNESTEWELNSSGVWKKQVSTNSVTLDLSGYYTSAETDTEISDAITDFQTNTADHRYLRVGTGTSIADGTNLNTCTTLGKFRNSNASNGCRNMPLEVAGRPFTLIVENMYGTQRYKQTLWLGQANYVDRFYWRIMTTNDPDTGWSDWYKVTGTAVTTDVPTP